MNKIFVIFKVKIILFTKFHKIRALKIIQGYIDFFNNSPYENDKK